MKQNCKDCKFKYTYENCKDCYGYNKYVQGDPKEHFLTRKELSKVCTYFELKEEGCKKCELRLRCLLVKKEI